VPEAPPPAPTEGEVPLLADEPQLAQDESYGADERALNEFVGLHPMCSMGKPTHSNTHINPACALRNSAFTHSWNGATLLHRP